MKLLISILTTLLISTASFDQSSDNVIICDSDGAIRYHSHTCSGMDKCTHERKTITKSEAEKLGRTPCKICYKTTSTTDTKSSDGRCTATTKKGTRCKRNSESGRGKCWQQSPHVL